MLGPDPAGVLARAGSPSRRSGSSPRTPRTSCARRSPRSAGTPSSTGRARWGRTGCRTPCAASSRRRTGCPAWSPSCSSWPGWTAASSLDLTENRACRRMVADAVADAQAVEPQPAGQRQERRGQPGGGGRRAGGSGRCWRTCSATSARTRRRGPPSSSGSSRPWRRRRPRGLRRRPRHVPAGRGARVRPVPSRRPRRRRPACCRQRGRVGGRQRPRAVDRAGDRGRARRVRHAQVERPATGTSVQVWIPFPASPAQDSERVQPLGTTYS